eukprot:gene31486-38054_t
MISAKIFVLLGCLAIILQASALPRDRALTAGQVLDKIAAKASLYQLEAQSILGSRDARSKRSKDGSNEAKTDDNDSVDSVETDKTDNGVSSADSVETDKSDNDVSSADSAETDKGDRTSPDFSFRIDLTLSNIDPSALQSVNFQAVSKAISQILGLTHSHVTAKKMASSHQRVLKKKGGPRGPKKGSSSSGSSASLSASASVSKDSAGSASSEDSREDSAASSGRRRLSSSSSVASIPSISTSSDSSSTLFPNSKKMASSHQRVLKKKGGPRGPKKGSSSSGSSASLSASTSVSKDSAGSASSEDSREDSAASSSRRRLSSSSSVASITSISASSDSSSDSSSTDSSAPSSMADSAAAVPCSRGFGIAFSSPSTWVFIRTFALPPVAIMTQFSPHLRGGFFFAPQQDVMVTVLADIYLEDFPGFQDVDSLSASLDQLVSLAFDTHVLKDVILQKLGGDVFASADFVGVTTSVAQEVETYGGDSSGSSGSSSSGLDVGLVAGVAVGGAVALLLLVLAVALRCSCGRKTSPQQAVELNMNLSVFPPVKVLDGEPSAPPTAPVILVGRQPQSLYAVEVVPVAYTI